MVILHICSITNNKASGISKVVPEHFKFQQKYANVGILNCNKQQIEKLNNETNVFYLEKTLKIAFLPEPFNHPDIVVFHGIYIPEFLKLAKELVTNNIPYIIIPHGSLTSNAQNTKKIKKLLGNYMFFNKFINNAKSIQYLSLNEAQMSKGFKKPSFVLSNGITKAQQTKKTFNQDCLKLIYIGRYDIYIKGLDMLIEACVKEKNYLETANVTIDLYGTAGDGLDALNKLIIKNDVTNIIKAHDAIFEEEKITELLNHDVFIQTSRTEGQPLGIIEAMSLGLPIIATSGTTFKDIVTENDCGFGCETSPEGIIEALHAIIDNQKNLPSFGKNSYNYVCNNLLWEAVAKKTVEKYHLIVTGANIYD